MPTNLIVPIIAPESALRTAAAARAAGASLFELRVDLIGDPVLVESLLADSQLAARSILTIRTASEGGAWDGDEDERIALYERLGLQSPGWLDIEFATWQRSANIRQKIELVASGTAAPASTSARPRSSLILSHHDLASTPDDAALSDLLARIRAARPAVAKIVTTARDGRDALRVLSLLSNHSAAGPLMALAMGEAGLATRVLAPKFNAWGTFATIDAGSESAPGQLTIDDLRTRFRYDAINPATRIFAVLGWPVAQSKSPLVHNAAMAHDTIDAVYLPLPISPSREAFFEFMDRIAAEPSLGFSGFSVTIPHKEHALAWLETHSLPISPLARRCGAVNTLTHDVAGWRGDNTDALGAWSAIAAHCAKPDSRCNALILGAGGAARGLAAMLIDQGIQVTVTNRSAPRAASMAAELGVRAVDWSARSSIQPAILVNCTSVGMWPDIDESPFPASSLASTTLVFDTIYNPAQTRLLRDAAAAGCPTISGVEMFLAQAAAQYKLWHARPAPLDIMRAALASAPR